MTCGAFQWLTKTHGGIQKWPSGDVVHLNVRPARHEYLRCVPMKPREIHLRSERADQCFQEQNSAIDFTIEIMGKLARRRRDIGLDHTVSVDRILIDKRAAQRQHRRGERQSVQYKPLSE